MNFDVKNLRKMMKNQAFKLLLVALIVSSLVLSLLPSTNATSDHVKKDKKPDHKKKAASEIQTGAISHGAMEAIAGLGTPLTL